VLSEAVALVAALVAPGHAPRAPLPHTSRGARATPSALALHAPGRDASRSSRATRTLGDAKAGAKRARSPSPPTPRAARRDLKPTLGDARTSSSAKPPHSLCLLPARPLLFACGVPFPSRASAPVPALKVGAPSAFRSPPAASREQTGAALFPVADAASAVGDQDLRAGLRASAFLPSVLLSGLPACRLHSLLFARAYGGVLKCLRGRVWGRGECGGGIRQPRSVAARGQRQPRSPCWRGSGGADSPARSSSPRHRALPPSSASPGAEPLNQRALGRPSPYSRPHASPRRDPHDPVCRLPARSPACCYPCCYQLSPHAESPGDSQGRGRGACAVGRRQLGRGRGWGRGRGRARELAAPASRSDRTPAISRVFRHPPTGGLCAGEAAPPRQHSRLPELYAGQHRRCRIPKMPSNNSGRLLLRTHPGPLPQQHDTHDDGRRDLDHHPPPRSRR
jgi:hypothetical protein